MPGQDPDRSLSPSPDSGAPRPSEPGRGSGGRPAALVAACAIVLLEGVVMAGLAVFVVTALVSGASQLPGAMAFLAGFCALIAAVLVASARALMNGKRWARSPVITWQVLVAVMGVGWYGAEQTVGTAVALVAATAVVTLLLLPSVVATTRPPVDGEAQGHGSAR